MLTDKSACRNIWHIPRDKTEKCAKNVNGFLFGYNYLQLLAYGDVLLPGRHSKSKNKIGKHLLTATITTQHNNITTTKGTTPTKTVEANVSVQMCDTECLSTFNSFVVRSRVLSCRKLERNVHTNAPSGIYIHIPIHVNVDIVRIVGSDR